MNVKRFFGTLVLGLGLTLVLLAGLQVQAKPAATNFFVKPAGSGTGCTQVIPCALHIALSQAANGDTIYIASGSYTGKGTHDIPVITVTHSITLYGGWSGSPIGPPITRDPARFPSVLDGEGMRRVVHISGDITPTLDGFTIANGNATGLVTDCEEYKPDGCGGGIFIRDAHPIIANNIISNNVAAITTFGSPTGTTGYGGGLYLENAARAIISGNLIINNVASLAYCGQGGGIHLWQYGDSSGVQVQFNQVLSNTATTLNDACASGGGISGGPDGVMIQGNSIIGNRTNYNGSGLGAGLYQWFGSASYLNNLIMENLGSADSQAVYLGYSASRFEGNRVVDNAPMDGIELFNGTGSDPTLVNNVIVRNGAHALVAHGYVNYPLTVNLRHNTLVGSGSGYGIYVETGYVTLSLINTIIAGHTWSIANTSPASSTVSANHTLFWANTHDDLRGTSPVDGDPAFAADGYHLGSSCSAAIDAGLSAVVMTDIDGETRPQGHGYDIGADEFPTGFACWHVYLPLVLR